MSEPAFHQFKLRLPVDLFRELEAAATAANRSVSAEMIHRLEASLGAQTPPRAQELAPDEAAAVLRSRLASIETMIANLEASMTGSDFDPDITAMVRTETDSLRAFADRIRHTLVFVLKSKYSGDPMPNEAMHMVHHLTRLSF